MKTAFITGSSRGIGQAAAYKLANTYDCIAILSRNTDGSLLETAKTIEATTNCKCIPFVGDAADFSFVEYCVSELSSANYPVDTLINNAGISLVGLFQDLTPEDFDRILRVNVSSVYNTCHAILPDMVRRQSGRILNISSVWGLVGASCEVAYSATKGAINSLTMALAKELAPSHIAVNAIAFGAVDTAMNGHLSKEEAAMLCDEIPAERMATPEEAADCIFHVLSMPDYMTGEILKFDGGWI